MVLFWSVIMPAIDRAVKDREIAPGTVFDIGPATFTPASGWNQYDEYDGRIPKGGAQISR